MDDEPDTNILYHSVLENAGYTVESYENPLLALSNFTPGYYDLAVLDIRLPKMNGFQLCRKLRDVDKSLKICFLTATELLYYQETDSDVIDDLGIDCFVSKPVDNEDFVSKLEAILSYSSLNFSDPSTFNTIFFSGPMTTIDSKAYLLSTMISRVYNTKEKEGC